MSVASAEIGHNSASAFEIVTERIQALYDEAKNWLDGDELQSEEQHNALVDLVKQIRKAKKEADESRKEEARPFDEGKAEIQERYNPFIQTKKGLADRAIEVANQALAPYLAKRLEEQRAERDRLRREAEETAAEATKALQDSKGDLEAREYAEELLQRSKKADAAVSKAAKQNVAKGARTTFDVVLSDRMQAAQHVWSIMPEYFDELLVQFGKDQVRQGIRTVPGYSITERKVV